MNSPSPIFSHLSLAPFLLLLLFRISSADVGDLLYDSCAATFSCGFISGLGYPFRPYTAPVNCGYPGLALKCQRGIPTIQIMESTYRLLDLNLTSQTMQIARDDVTGSDCPRDLVNTTLDDSLFEYSPGHFNLTFLYGCPEGSSPRVMPVSGCTFSGYKNVYLLTGYVAPFECETTVTVPVSARFSRINSSNLVQALGEGVEVRWKVNGNACSKCTESKGRCGFDVQSNQTSCFCPHPPYVSAACRVVDAEAPSSEASPGPGSSSSERTIVVLVVTVATAVLVTIIFIYLIRGRLMSLIGMMGLWKEDRLNDQNDKVFMRHYGSLAPTQYRHSDIVKITNSFKDKIGQGGYGTVYKGKLNDGRLVAVKVLSKTKGNGEEFINEVASISRTSHVNVVALLGFCFERKRRALVYDFMANGSLDKFIHNDESQSTNCHLEWRTMYQIAVGIAKGLGYLHRGCSTRIVHFDIKPHNILLDEDFCPKISDFGLAKLCQRKESIMSMLGTRGTIGYIAPELFSRAFGGVSHKSDVYSYGMLVLEMSGATQNIGVSQTSEVYFPNWIYEHLEHGKDLRLQRITSGDDEEIARKMILVGLWCIQTNPSDRPAMNKVVEMLEGSIQSLQIPPKPLLFSPARSATYSQDSSMSSPRMDHVVEVPEGRLQSMPIPPKPQSLPHSKPHQTS